jgi:hypothetical protein
MVATVLAAAGSCAAVACPRLYSRDLGLAGKGTDHLSADACLCGVESLAVSARPAMCPIRATKPRPGAQCASTDVRERSVDGYYIWVTGIQA